ncbi:MAG: tetratricopeptide repeat protein [Anaerolineae bacterium]|nr:tetratricopeptide repeat protein [Anaerolineae bacterium]
MSDVFISYSRVDKEFVGNLREMLLEKEQNVWIDWENIPPSQSWWDEIKKGIARANNVVVVLSPNSMASPICQMEIEYARELKKRIIPVFIKAYQREEMIKAIQSRMAVKEEITTREIWAGRNVEHLFDANDNELKHINFFMFPADADFEKRFEELFAVIRADYAHKEEHTSLQTAAQLWDRQKRDSSYLLLDKELEDAEAWLAKAAGKIPPPTELHLAFIEASKKRTRQLRNIRRASVAGVVVSVVAIVFALAAAWIGVQANESANLASTREADAVIRGATAESEVLIASTREAQALNSEATANVQVIAASTRESEALNSEATANAQVIVASTRESEALNSEATANAQVLLANTAEASAREQANIASTAQANAIREQEITDIYSKAMQSLTDGFPEAAIYLFDTLIVKYPDVASIYNFRGLVFYALNDNDKALADYSHAIELNPLYADAINNRGNVYDVQGDPESAAREFERAIEADPQYANAYYNLGIHYLYDSADYASAIGYLSTYIELVPRDPYGYVERGYAQSFLGRYDEAIADYVRAIELNPDYAASYNNRGNAYLDLGEYDDALGDYNRAIELDPEYAVAYNNRGNAYLDLGEYDNALGDYNRAIELDPEYANAYFNRALTHYDLGDYEDAVADYDRYLEFYPEDADAYYNRGLSNMNLALAGENIDPDVIEADFERAVELGMTIPNDVEDLLSDLGISIGVQ